MNNWKRPGSHLPIWESEKLWLLCMGVSSGIEYGRQRLKIMTRKNPPTMTLRF
jgi:hypothetical protein